MRARADARARPPTNSHARLQMHARLASAMEAYADGAAVAGLALPDRLWAEMKLHRSRAGGFATEPASNPNPRS